MPETGSRRRFGAPHRGTRRTPLPAACGSRSQASARSPRERRTVISRALDIDITSEAAAVLTQIPLFAGCSRTEIRSLAQSARALAFEPGEVLCASGTDAGACYVVTEGHAEVKVGNITVDTVDPVDVVGERGPITGRPRAATVRATTPIVAYAIPREALQDVMARSEAAASAMRDELLRRYG